MFNRFANRPISSNNALIPNWSIKSVYRTAFTVSGMLYFTFKFVFLIVL